mgnify:CR=1 FL=1
MQAARALLSTANVGISTQVLQEFYAFAISKKRLQMSHDEAVAVLNSLSDFPVCPITRELVLEAVNLRQRFQISYWDAAIIAAAKRMGCGTVYSEDLNPEQDYDGVLVVNPFASLTEG